MDAVNFGGYVYTMQHNVVAMEAKHFFGAQADGYQPSYLFMDESPCRVEVYSK